jgi:hypothetical protein
MDKKNSTVFFCILTTLALLLFDTGLHGDDYIVISNLDKSDILGFLNLEGARIMALNTVTYYSFWWPYFLLGNEYQWAYDLIKIVAHAISIFFVYKFSTDYLPKDRAILVSLIFILYPLHDTTAYWYMTTPYIFIPATILYAHHLIRNNKTTLGFYVSMLGAFSYYISPPYIFGLSLIFLFEKNFKKAIIFVTPGVLYVAYYFWIKLHYAGVERRIDPDLGVLDFFKQILIQPLSFLESAIGPSYWLKVFYAIESISLVSVIIVVLISVFAFIKIESFSKAPNMSKSLYIGLISVLLLSFGMFALTGLYSHSAFNLGNRTTVYGSLFIAFLLAALLPANKKSAIFLLIIFLAPVFGLSDHWKNWNENQKVVIENIKNNQDLKEIESDSTLIITGNLYSKLGEYSHIEFFSMPWNVNAIFHNNTKTKTIVAITPYTEIREGYLVDPKFSGKYSLNNKLYLYDSENDIVREISSVDLPELIEQQPKLIRHWVQLFKDTWIEDVVVWLSPRLVYLFK